MKHSFWKSLFCLTAIIVSLGFSVSGSAAILDYTETGRKGLVEANAYKNWEGVSNISQFLDKDGNYCFACDAGDKVIICHTNNGAVIREITLDKPYELFGAVECDAEGYYYLVTGQANDGMDMSVPTVFLSKYSPDGQLIRTVGDNGSSSLAYYYSETFRTQKPFSNGNCDIAISGDYVAVNYARTMYSRHQSNSVWVLDRATLTTQTQKEDGTGLSTVIYNSHSFAQRAIPFRGGFLFLSEGDCFPRAFSAAFFDVQNNTTAEGDIFHFWVRKNAYKDYNMYDINNNFAHTGDICELPGGRASFVATSVKSLNQAAASEKEQLFIQIFDPSQDLSSAAAYVTPGIRTGLAGPDGDEETTDYGVKWLTGYKDKTISYPQAVADENGNTIILFQLNSADGETNLGVYSMIVDASGNIRSEARRIAKRALLNAYETPVYKNGTIWWTGNLIHDPGEKVCVFSYRPYAEGEDFDATAIISIDETDISPLQNEIYSGKACTPVPEIIYDDELLKAGTDFTVEYKNNVNAGTASVTITGQGDYKGTATFSFTIEKAPQPMTLKAKSVAVRYSRLLSKDQTLKISKAVTRKKSKGDVSYKKLKGNKKLLVDKATGKITVKKGLKKGVYSLKIKITAAGGRNYKKGSGTVTVKITVK